MKEFYIYKIFNLLNSKIYIGQSQSKYRWKNHIYTSAHPEYHKHMLVHKAMFKCGIRNFEFRIIQYFSTLKDCLAAEKYWINFYQTNVCRYPNGLGYNLTDGGDTGTLGLKWSKESKKNFSEQTRGENNNSSLLKEKEVIEIKQLLLQEISMKEIATKYHTSYTCINSIRKGKTWSHIVIGTNSEITNMSRKLSTLGNILSQETRDKMSESQLAMPNDIRQKVIAAAPRGEKHPQAKITKAQALEIKKLIAEGIKPIKVASLLKISKHIIYDINSGKTWKHIP